MPDYDFSQVDCLLYEPVNNIRRLLRDALTQLRLTKVQLFGRFEELRAAVEAGPADLLIADGGDAGAELFELIHKLRHGHFRGNPFMGIIVTAFNPTQQLLLRVTNSGADTLLVKPVSPRVVRDRIVGLVEETRKFVVTSDFIGPDRRRSARGGKPAPLLPVPNSLRAKAMGLGTAGLLDDIETAMAIIDVRKRTRQAFQVSFLLEFARPGLAGERPDPMALEHLARIPTVTEDLCRRLSPGDEALARPPAAVLAQELGEDARRIRRACLAGEPPAGFEAACERALDLLVTLSPSGRREELIEEVREAVSAYRARIERFMRARQASLQPVDRT